MRYLPPPNTKSAVFDFDGTIADTSEGILDAHRTTMRALGIEDPGDEGLKRLIGENLFRVYAEKYGLGEAGGRKAAALYRERYAGTGIHLAALYPGFREMLETLRAAGIRTGVATLKAERFAETMLEEMGIRGLFDAVCGIGADDRMDKAGLIAQCMARCGSTAEETVLVGDTENDRAGAEKAGTGFIGVTYGFGFRKGGNADFLTADDPAAVAELILGRNGLEPAEQTDQAEQARRGGDNRT